VGITFANKVLGRYGRLAEVVGGLTLIVIGLRIFLQHVT
jgi:putative Mn2+ efflux pump MntP